jgi:AIPR protein
MGKKTHRFVVHEARRITHHAHSEIEKYWFTIPAGAFPAGISTGANARDPIGLNRRVYRDVMESLKGNTAPVGIFDLMNKGITILADQVRLIDKEKKIYDIVVDDDLGIVDGAHTAKLIEEAQADDEIPDEQHVEVYVRTGLPSKFVAEIAKGLNTGIQVRPQSIYAIGGVFDWLQKEIASKPYSKLISWSESDDGEYDVRDLIGVLELLNVADFPNGESRHPVAAYEKWSIPLEKFAQDYKEHIGAKKSSKYYQLRPILTDGLRLHDIIRRDFRELHNRNGGQAGKLKIIEEASARRKEFEFPFAGLQPSKYRLTKGALYPILAAFRNCVKLDRNGEASWIGGFESVLSMWKEAGPELVAEMFQATKDHSHNPDVLGKSRAVWSGLHKTLELRMLRRELKKRA